MAPVLRKTRTQARTHVASMKIPMPRDDRSVFLREEARKFAESGTQHWSPSGMTALLFAEAVLRKGESVTLKIHPREGIVLTRGDSGE